MTEEELHEQINKLKISSIQSNVKQADDNNLPVMLNPFCRNADSKTNKLHLFATKCNCKSRLRCTSESFLDDPRSFSNSAGIERTIIHSTQFKHKNCKISNNRRKSLLRDPVLKNLNSGFNENAMKPCCGIVKETDNLIKNPIDAIENRSSTVEALDLDNMKIVSKTDTCLDLRSLIDQCQCLSLKKNQCIKSPSSSSRDCFQKISKKFNALQNHDSRSKQKSLNNPRSWRKLSVSQQELINNNGNQSTNTSCSQQARINEATASTTSQQQSETSCDVTIDELASYFETLVYIPKKMSSMAEMMYI